MPKLQLTQQFVDNPPIVQHKTKTDYFDTRLTGFFLEVRATGKATYYQRYRDKHRKNRQVRIGPGDAMSLEEANDIDMGSGHANSLKSIQIPSKKGA